MKLFLIAAAIGLVIGAGPEFKAADEVHTMLWSNFTYVEQGADDVLVTHPGDVPFEGDCDDFAMAAFYQLYMKGLQPEFLMVDNAKTGNAHALVCLETYCVDNTQRNVYPRSKFEELGYTIVQSTKQPIFVFFEMK
jgi:hypothetical protein